MEKELDRLNREKLLQRVNRLLILQDFLPFDYSESFEDIEIEETGIDTYKISSTYKCTFAIAEL